MSAAWIFAADRRIFVSFSLEVKKFINSEHTGEYVDIMLPLPVEEPVRPSKKAAAAADGESAPESAPEPQFETVKLHYMEAGEGEPLILVHSVGQSLYTWRNLFDRLSQHYRTIALDLPGHGYSSRPESFGYAVEDIAFSIRAFMDAMGIKSAHFVGFSLGCAPVMRIAADNPERVGRVVLLSPGGVTPDMPLAVRLIDSPLLGFAASYLYNMRTCEKLLDDAVFDLTNITPDVVQEYYRTISDGASRRAVRMSLQYFEDEAVIASLRDVQVPVLILQGSEDKWHPAEVGAELYHAAMRNAAFSVVRNAGHLIQEEKPERILAALLEFIPVVMPE